MTTESVLAPFERDVLLATGRAVHVRPAGPFDLDNLKSFYGQLDDRSTYFRFFSLRKYIPDDELERATTHDVQRHVTLVAVWSGTIVGVGEYHAAPGADHAEVAFAVADAHHHEGIATVLLEDLALIAKSAGFRRLVAETLPANAAMLGVFRAVGLVHRVWFEDGVVQVQLDLTADDLLQDDADLRDWKAAVRSLRSIVEPAHVVVIGAGDDPTSPGWRVLANLRACFRGRVTVDDVADVPDLAIIAVPAPDVTDAVTRCGVAGVPSAVVISAGFAEAGPGGARMQDEVLATARRYGMRIVGPNSLGVVATACGLNATVTSQTFLPGGIAVASQSGGVGVAIAAEARRRDAGISSFVSMGNKIDVSGNDLLRLWADDGSTKVVLLYLESFGDPVRFARIARAVSQRKPVVALKSGGSGPGQRGARSHTAALPSDETMVDALFAHTGVIRARTLEELIDVGLLLDLQVAPAGRRVALIGNAGGPLVLGADAADANGLAVPVLSAPVQDEIGGLVPRAPSTLNPVDLGPGATPEALVAAVRAIGRSGEVDACIVVCVDLGERHHLDDVAVLLTAAGLEHVTVALSFLGTDPGEHGALPTFPTPERATVAVALAARRASWLVSIADDAVDDRLDAAAFVDAHRLARRHAGGGVDITWMDAPASLELLDEAGLPVAQRFGDQLRGVAVQTPETATLELRVGAIRDPAFGPLVVVGAGGVEADLRDDRVVLVAPVAASAARRAIESLRLAPLFHGFRGRPELPVERVVEVVQRIAMLAAAVPEIQQLDVNPLLVAPQGCVAVDARIGVAAPRSPVVPVRGLRGGQT